MSGVAEGSEMNVDWLMSLCHRVIQTPDCFRNKTCYLLFAYDTKRDKMGDRTSLQNGQTYTARAMIALAMTGYKTCSLPSMTTTRHESVMSIVMKRCQITPLEYDAIQAQLQINKDEALMLTPHIFLVKDKFPCSIRFVACSNACLFSLTTIGQASFFHLSCNNRVYLSSLHTIYSVCAALSSIYCIISTTIR